MKIIDKRIGKEKLSWNDLQMGNFYLADDGTILLKTDEGRYVHLGDLRSDGGSAGELYKEDDFDNAFDEKFIELDVTLVINGEK